MVGRSQSARDQGFIVPRGGPPYIGELREPVWVCTTVEKPDQNVSTLKTRPGVINVHARIRPMHEQEILDYLPIFNEGEKPNTEIIIRWPPDVKVDARHWVYHESTDHMVRTWYRVRKVRDMGGLGRFLLMLCSIDQIFDARSDPATQQLPPRWEDPDRLKVREEI